MWESASIVRYLAAAYRPSLLGGGDGKAGAAARAKASAWMDYHLSTFSPGSQIYGDGDFIKNLMNNLVRLPAEGALVRAHGKEARIQPCAETVGRAAVQAMAQFGRLVRTLPRITRDTACAYANVRDLDLVFVSGRVPSGAGQPLLRGRGFHRR